MADRFQRIWSIVERIDAEPGLGRRQLAEEFALSERQLQADLEVIRLEMGFPLTRRQGYRFDGHAPATEGLGLQDAVILARLARASRDQEEPPVSADALHNLLARVASAFPARFQPFARAVLCGGMIDDIDHASPMLITLAESLLRQEPVRVRLLTHASPSTYQELTVDPQLLIPYGEAWYFVGYCHERRRDVMIALNELQPHFVERPLQAPPLKG